jgi:hypothetical protein
MTHTQWICRNITKHHKTRGTKALDTAAAIRREIEHQLNLGSDGLSPETKCLLEIPPEELFGKSTQQKQYWLNAAIAGRKAAGDETGGALPQPPLEITATTVKNNGEKEKEIRAQKQQTGTKLAPIFTAKVKAHRQHQQSPESSSRQALPPPIQRGRSDKIGFLCVNSQEELTACPVVDLIRRPPIMSTHDQQNTVLELDGKDTISDQGMKSLNPGTWINDEIINGYLLRVLKPALRNTNVHFFHSFFMSQLLNTGRNGRAAPRYTYNNVKKWDKNLRRRHKILGVREIFVPINHKCEHWLLLRANTESKVITLWDSQGRKPSNKLYLETMLRYLGDKFTEHIGGDCEAWMASWTLVDESELSPRQSNGYDCGIFTMCNATFLAQHLPLSASTYRELDFQLSNTRQRVAMLLWQASRNQPQPRPQTSATSGTRPSHKQRQHTSSPCKIQPKKKATTKLPSSTTYNSRSKERQRRRRRQQSIIPGGPKTRGKTIYSDPSPLDQLVTQINRKRTAGSLAASEAARSPSTQRHRPPKKKKRRINQQG